MIVSDIISSVRLITNDNASGAYRNQDADIIGWINAGIEYIGSLRPASLNISVTTTLVAGTKQSLTNFTPAGQELLDVYRSGTQVVRKIDRDILDSTNPSWHADPSSSVITNYCYDERDPLTFWVYPPAQAGASLDVVYVQTPTLLSATNEAAAIPLSQEYVDALTNYVLFWAYAKETADDHNAQLAAMYRKNCDDYLMGKDRADLTESPELNNPGSNVRKSASAGGI